MRPFRDNRNIYRIWKKYKTRGLSRYPGFFVSTLLYLLKTRERAWAYIRELANNGCICEINHELYPDIQLYLPCFRTDLIQKLIVRNEAFFEDKELNLLKRNYITEGSVVCDCGAYIGNHTVFFGKICKARRIFAFEPSEEAFRILTRNIGLNDLNGVVSAFETALGDEDGFAELIIRDRNNLGAAHIKSSADGNVTIRRLDDIIPSEEEVDFLKIDVEGSEYLLLKGAERILDKDGPVIFIEVFPENFRSVDGLLTKHGYSMREEYGDDNYLYCKSTVC